MTVHSERKSIGQFFENDSCLWSSNCLSTVTVLYFWPSIFLSAVIDHLTAVTDRSTAVTDHSTVVTDHSTAVTDHSTVVTDHPTVVTDQRKKL